MGAQALRTSSIKRLTLARYLFGLAEQHAKDPREVSAFACINLLHDAIEMFLVSSADHLNAKINQRTEFVACIDILNDKLGDKEIPYRKRLIEINKVRVSAKHDGIRPDSTELEEYVDTSRSFFEEACSLVFSKDFWSISLVEMLDDGECKTLLLGAQSAFASERYLECLIACRKAIFIEFECSFDIKMFLHPSVASSFYFSQAPASARSTEYVHNHVREPFDYIVVDHDRLDADLLRDGISPGILKNIMRLTPMVYRHKPEDEWAVQQLGVKSEAVEARRNSAAYVLDSTIDVMMKLAAAERSMRTPPRSVMAYITVAGQVVEIYRKADRESEVIARTSDKETKLLIEYATPGLNEPALFWKVKIETPNSDPRFSYADDYGYIYIGDE